MTVGRSRSATIQRQAGPPAPVPAIGLPATAKCDVRLVPAAVASWLTAAWAPLLPAGVLAAISAVALGAAAWLLSRRPLPTHRSGRASALACLLAGVALVGGTAAAQVLARDASPLRQLSAQGKEVMVRMTVTDSIRMLSPGESGSRVLFPARVVSVTCERACGDVSVRSWTHVGTVLVFASAAGWSALPPGTTASASVTLAPARPLDLLVGVAFARGPPEHVEAAGWLDQAAGRVRGALRERAEATLAPAEAGLLRGIVVGDTAGMDPNLAEDFRLSGLAHLTAVSGTNCAIVIGAVLWPLRRSRFRAPTRSLIAALALVGFVVLAGPQPSVLRAAAMGAVTLLALATGRVRQALPALAATVMILLAIDAALARDLGFALSVAATAGIVVLTPGWTGQLTDRRWPAALATAVAVCAAAGLSTAPLLVLISARVSLVSLPANLLVIPVVALVTVLGLAAALIAPTSPWTSEVLLRLADWPLRWMVWIAERAARTPGAALPWPGSAWGALLLVIVIVIAMGLLRRRRLRWLLAAGCIGIVISGVSVRMLAPGWPPTGWFIVACDVGQGDALAVSLGPGSALVVDAGPDPILVDACLRRLGVDQVPLVILSHLHADHIDGLSGVLHGRTVGAVATGIDPQSAEALAQIRRTTRAAGAALAVLESGDTRVVESATIEALGPVARYVETRSDPNNSSIVARVTVRGVSILFTGDIEIEAQGDLLRRGVDLHADVLKVAHHGSAYQDPDFLSAVGARVALISVGTGNDYGHPDHVVLDRLRGLGMAVHRTDDESDVAVAVRDGSEIVVQGRSAAVRAGPEAAPVLPHTDRPRSGPIAVARCRHGRRPRVWPTSGPGRGRVPSCQDQVRCRGGCSGGRSGHRGSGDRRGRV